MKVRIIKILCKKEDLKDLEDIVLGNGRSIKQIYYSNEEPWKFPCLIYENEKGEKWIAEENDYMWGLMEKQEQDELDI